MSEKQLNGAGGRIAERAVGERSDVAAARAARDGVPDPELVERAKRRRFTAEYKLRILREAEACSRPGEIGALLRREGLYTSHLTAWRKQRDQGALEALDRPRGRKPADRRDAENAALRRRLERAEAELEKARRVIEVQGNVSALLGELLEPRGAKPDGSTGR
jgi:transposase-like protein